MRRLLCSDRRFIRPTWQCWALCLGLLLPSPGLCANENTTVILNAQIGGFDCINGPIPFDCESSTPTVTVAPGDVITVQVFLRNYDNIEAFACRFAVDGGSGMQTWGDWTLLATYFGCLPGQVSHVPSQNAPPPAEPGNLVTGFSCLTGGSLRFVGWMLMQVGSSGCLGIEEREFGTGVQDCSQEFTAIPASNRGRICVGPGGYDACEPVTVPIENSTWGQIKQQYR
jgi:hypothetical protein